MARSHRHTVITVCTRQGATAVWARPLLVPNGAHKPRLPQAAAPNTRLSLFLRYTPGPGLTTDGKLSISGNSQLPRKPRLCGQHARGSSSRPKHPIASKLASNKAIRSRSSKEQASDLPIPRRGSHCRPGQARPARFRSSYRPQHAIGQCPIPRHTIYLHSTAICPHLR
jgi:hypothetical protein